MKDKDTFPQCQGKILQGLHLVDSNKFSTQNSESAFAVEIEFMMKISSHARAAQTNFIFHVCKKLLVVYCAVAAL